MNLSRPVSTTRLGRRFAAVALSVAALSGLATSTAAPASAASVGVFNTAQCNPNNRTVTQTMEAYRSNANEYIVLQGALVERATSATSYSQWHVGTGATAYAVITWGNVARGSYNAWFRWSIYNRATRSYATSRWVQVRPVQLLTYGRPMYPGSDMFIGGSSGCSI